MNKIKLSKRSAHQVEAARVYLADQAVTTASTVTIEGDAAEVKRIIDGAVVAAKAKQDKGATVALRSLYRAVEDSAREARKSAATKAAPAQPVGRKPVPARTEKPRFGGDGPLARYEVAYSRKRYTMLRNLEAATPERPAWVTVCEHGTQRVVESGAAAEQAGRDRAGWCPECKKAPAKAPSPERVAAKSAPSGQLAPRTRRQRAEAAKKASK